MLKIYKHNLYLFTFGSLVILYMLNQFAEINNIKMAYFMVPVVLIVYLYKKIKITKEIKILIFFIFILYVNLLHAVTYPFELNIVFKSTNNLLIILLMIIPFFSLYKTNYRLFDKLFLFSIIITIISNYYYYFNYYDHMERFRGTFGNPNEFALILVMMSYFILYLLHIEKRSKYFIFISIILLFMLSSLVLITLSRSGIILLILLYLFYFYSIRKNLNIFMKLLIGIIFFSMILFVYYTFSEEINFLIDRFKNSTGSTNSRFDQIEAAINLLKHYPSSIIFGTGLSATADIQWFSKFYIHHSIEEIVRIHNSLFSLLVETGFLGLVTYLYLHFVIFLKIIKQKNHIKYLLIGCLVSMFLYSQFAYIVYFFPYWLGLAILSNHSDRLAEIRKIK